jgi:lipid-A-disaccharide synthase
MRVFVSAGEPSGDLHGANLVRALREARPDVEVVGFGGERMRQAGCPLLYPLCDLAVTGFLRVVGSLPRFSHALSLADRFFSRHRPDVVALIDFPGFHWWLARRAKEHGIPVVYFVPPQIWGWASWRVRKLRRLTDKVLCNLPFELDWYRRRHVDAEYVGHPYFDELRAQRLDPYFVGQQRQRPGTVVALLPGSRRSEVEHNTPSLLRAAALIHRRRPDVRFLVACFNAAQRDRVAEMLRPQQVPVEVFARRTPEIIHLAHSCLAVSGSVSLELLYRLRPSVILYREMWLLIQAARVMKRVPFITLVNLLAGKDLFPEFLTSTGTCPAEGMAAHVLRWLGDAEAYEGVVGELTRLRERVAEPGACERAARWVLEVAGRPARRRAA